MPKYIESIDIYSYVEINTIYPYCNENHQGQKVSEPGSRDTNVDLLILRLRNNEL